MIEEIAFWLAVGIVLGCFLEWLRVKMLSLVLVTETEMVLRDVS